MKIAVITPLPTPYRDPFWNVVAAEPDIDLDVFYCNGEEANRPWTCDWDRKFNSDVLGGVNLTKYVLKKPHRWQAGLSQKLAKRDYDAIILGGYDLPNLLVAWRYSLRSNTPYYLMNESYLAQPRSWWRRLLKGPLVRSICRQAAGGFPTGILATEYLEHYGIARDKMCKVPNVPDVDAYWKKAQELAPSRLDIRKALGFDDDPVILFVGRLVPFKQPDLLLKSFAALLKKQPAKLVYLGHGPMLKNLRSLAKSLGVDDRISFPGFVQPDKLPRWYAAADLFVLPSFGETWSVVTIEALASGLPVVLTKLVGAQADALNDPRVGTAITPKSQEELTSAMMKHLGEDLSREEVGSIWAPVRIQMGYETIAKRMIDLLKKTGPS